MHTVTRGVFSATAALLFAPAAWCAGPPDVQALLAAQRQAMAVMAAHDGAWRGAALTLWGDPR